MKRARNIGVFAAVLGCCAAGWADAIVWNGPRVAFTKMGFVDPLLEENQDRITDDVWITRGNTQGLFNAASESSQGPTSPSGTMWSVGTTADIGSLTFDTWLNTVGPSSPIGGPPYSVGVDFVVHLIQEDIYFDLQFTQWGVGSTAGGSFAYTRSTMGGVVDADFNADGLIDAADYTIWRDTLNSTTDLRGDANGDSVVDQADYLAWVASYGGVQQPGVAIPETACLQLSAMALVLAAAPRCRMY